MTYDGDKLAALLPALYRIRDAELAAELAIDSLSTAEQAELAALEALVPGLVPADWERLEWLRAKSRRGPLAALLSILGQQFGVIEEDLAQLYDDAFVETASPWALPYIGDLIGYRNLSGRGPGVTARAELGHTIAFRRRKGTASMLEQLARDVTGWEAHVVESFQLLATTQWMNHRRLGNQVAPSMRDGSALELVATAFDRLPRTLDVRRLERGGGLHNLHNVPIYLWRIGARPLHQSPVVPDSGDPSGRRFRFSPLGTDIRLVTRPEREDVIEHLSEPINVPFPISRRRLEDDLADPDPRLYGEERSLALYVGGVLQGPASVAACNLSDSNAGGWIHDAPAGRIAVDPVLGRLAVAADLSPLAGPITVSFHQGGPERLGGGEYSRASSFATDVVGPLVQVPTDAATVTAALTAIANAGGSGTIEIVDGGRYQEAPGINLPADGAIEIRSADDRAATLELTAPWTVVGGQRSRLFINGLLVVGDVLRAGGAGNRLAELHVRNCTLVPGRKLAPNGDPTTPGAASLVGTVRGLAVEIGASIVGAIRLNDAATLVIDGSIVDAGEAGVALGATEAAPTDPAAPIDVESSTVIGRIYTRRICASNSILFGLVRARQRQDGCLRFSYAPPASQTPRRYRCQPGDGDAAANIPHFETLRFGHPAYARLADDTPVAVLRGAEDESEMGVFHRLYEPQRGADLAIRIDEYLRVGLEAGVLHAS